MANVMLFDNLLKKESFAALNAFAIELDKRASLYRTSIWQDNEENPIEGLDTFFCSPISNAAWASMLPKGMTVRDIEKLGDLKVCPTSTPVDSLFSALLEHQKDIEQVIGPFGETWVGIIGKVYAYGKGAKAVWHTDSGPYAGAFVYYAHAQWARDWGGQFLYADGPDASDNPAEGKFVTAAPNRLLVLRAGTLHTVANVSQSARDRPRLSFAGFFVRPDGVPILLQEAVRVKALREETGEARRGA